LKTLLHIVGNRPQFIKLAILYKELATSQHVNQKIIHTGQHFSQSMSNIFFDELNIPAPEVNFNIQNTSTQLFIGEATEKLYQYFLTQKEALVFVYGDTNTTLAGAMAAKRCGLQLVHFEAGVRTYDNTMPEEINRILTDRLADINYCCTQKNYDTMLAEGYGKAIPTSVLLTGDLMLDAFLKIEPTTLKLVKHDEYVVCTIHREANLSSKQNLENIVNALNELHKEIPIVMPMHPHTKKRIAEYGINTAFTILEPLGYADMKNLLKHSKYVITDSGGTSREAYFLKKKSLIIMGKPFWPEILEENCSLNAAAIEAEIIEKYHMLPLLKSNFETNVFGLGNAAENIREHLTSFLVS
jgi:UDP-GlcNAc3NAcA epimerase